MPHCSGGSIEQVDRGRKRARERDHGRPRGVYRHRARGRISQRGHRERARPAAAAETQESFVRTFAYASGPAYGLLLDASSPGWRQTVRATDDIAALVMRALAVQPVNDAASSAARYGGAELLASEQLRQRQRQERVAELRKRFVDGPVLVIPGKGGGSFDSRGAVPIPGVGTVYFGSFRFSGDSGTLGAQEGVLVTTDGDIRRVSAPVRRDDTSAAGDGWTFKAAPGWVIRDGPRQGDYEVVRQ